MRRILKWAAVAAATLLVVLIALLLSLPLLLDSDSVKAAALQHLSRATGGQWRVARLELGWLPRPTIRIDGASFDIPGTAAGKVEGLTLSTALLPLLWGDVRLAQIALTAPDITLTVGPAPASTAAAAPGTGTFTVSDLRAVLTHVSKLKAVDLRAVEFVIDRGRFVLAVPGQTSLTLSEINARAAHRSGRFEVEATMASDVSHRLDLKISLDPERFEGSIAIDATGLDLAVILGVAGAQGDPQLHGLVSARVQIKADSTPALRGTFDASSSALSIASGDSKLDLHDVVVAGEAQWTDSGLRLTGQEVRTAAPAVQAAAVLTFSPDWNRQRLEVKAWPMALETVKQLVLPWTTDAPQVERYARMITAGELSGLEATLQMDRIDHWQQAIEARGTLTGVAMALQQPALAIQDLRADLALAQGKLTAERVEAATGKSTVRNGHVELDFAAAQPGIAATAQWRADLGEALALARRQLSPGERARLEAVRALTGQARGAVSLTGTLEQPRVLLDVDTIRTQASVEPLPWPINLVGGKARFDGNALVVQGLTGNVGASGFSQCSGQITLSGAATLQVSGCEADLALVQLFDWASKEFALPEVAKNLRVLAGRGLVHARGISGPLARPAGWSGTISVTPKAVRLSHPDAPGELRLDGGSLQGDLSALTVQGVKVEVLDTALQVSGSVSGLRDGKPHLDVQASGPVREELLTWAWERAGISHEADRIAAFEARPVALRWPVNKGFETQGELMFAGRTSVSFDALIQPGVVDVRKLAVQDEQSKARMSIRWKQDVIEGSFSGDLAGDSLARIGRSVQRPDARLSGDLTYRVPLRQPRDFRADGQLRINQVTSAGWIAWADLTVRNAEITANERTLRATTSFSLRDTDFDVSGTIRGTDQRYALDIDVKSDRVDMNRLLRAREHAAGKPAEEKPMSWDFPVDGKVRLAIQSLVHHPYRIEPLLATLDIVPGHIDFAVKEAKVCGISMAGGGRGQPGTVTLDVVLRARGLDAAPTLRCLSNERTIVTGRLDADLHATATGPYREVPQRITGPFHLVARDGRVDRMTGLAKVLDLVNASELLRGKKLGLQGAGFAYSRFEATGKLEGGAILMDAVVLDAQPFDVVAHGKVDWFHDSVDMTVAVAPVQAVNSIVKLLPFLEYVMGGSVFVVPVGVRGSLSNLQVVPLAPTAVAGNLLGVLERTLKTPFNLRQALVPPAMQGGNAAAPPAPASPATGGSKP